MHDPHVVDPKTPDVAERQTAAVANSGTVCVGQESSRSAERTEREPTERERTERERTERERTERLRRALESMPDDYRTVILLRQQQNLSFDEIGLRLQLSTEATRTLWGQAIFQLGRLLHPDV